MFLVWELKEEIFVQMPCKIVSAYNAFPYMCNLVITFEYFTNFYNINWHNFYFQTDKCDLYFFKLEAEILEQSHKIKIDSLLVENNEIKDVVLQLNETLSQKLNKDCSVVQLPFVSLSVVQFLNLA